MISDQMSDALFLKLNVGESCRIVHEEDKEGNVCSVGKDAAMVVTRTEDGLKWYCHRCELGGNTYMKSVSPERTLKLLKLIREAKGEEEVVIEDFNLPSDVIHIYYAEGEFVKDCKEIPESVWDWFKEYNISAEALMYLDLEVYWSPSLYRVLFAYHNDDGELIAYIGRTMQPGAAKWMTFKRNDQGRILFELDSYTQEPGVVFTEDILSAIVVNLATGLRTVALLTTHFDYDVAKRYKGETLYLWLDGDMLGKSLRKTRRLQALGYDVKSIRSDEDPKCYSDIEIQKYLGVSDE